MKTRETFFLGLSLPLLIFFTIPIAALLIAGEPKIAETLTKEEAISAMRISLESSGLATLLALIFGLPLAYYVAFSRSPIAKLANVLSELPILLPPAVAGVALLLAFGRFGLAGRHLPFSLPFTLAAVVLAQLFVSAPFVIRAAAIGFARAGGELRDAAILDGADSRAFFQMVAVPVAAPAIFGGALMTWARALGEFGATLIFAGNMPGRTQTMPLAIYLGFEIEFSTAISLAAILLLGSFVILLTLRTVFARRELNW